MAEYIGDVIVEESQIDSDDDDCWDEPMDDGRDVTCLFCDRSFQTTCALWEHTKLTHQFDIISVKHRLRLDFYDYIKLINFIRAERLDCKRLFECTPPFPWEDEKYLHPVIQDDPLLQYDIEDSDSNEEPNSTQGHEVQNGGMNPDADDMNSRLNEAMEKARIAETALQIAMGDLETMRAGVRALILGADQETRRERGTPQDETVVDDDEDSYFSSYSHYSIHEEMLKDKVRTLSYKNFMHKNRHLFENKTVLDIGCGSGILSIFAAQAGAKKVFGIDKSSIVYNAMDIVRENKLDHIISLKRGKVEEIELDLKQVDVIISEWMGYFLLFESMLDTVVFARDKWLAPNGKVYPDKCSISVVGIEDKKRMDEKVLFWEDVYGVKMSCMKRLVLSEPAVDVVGPNTILTSNCAIKEIDVNEVRTEKLDFKSEFKLQAIRDGTLNIIVGYFDIMFEENCIEKISFSTHPSSPSTHWKQTLFYLERSLALQKGEIVHGFLQCKKNKKESRSLDVVIEIMDNISEEIMTNKYTLE